VAINLKAEIEQYGPSYGTEGNAIDLKATRLGQLFTADWKQRLLLAGVCWRVTVGSFGADTDVSMIPGGGGYLHCELEQPEVIVGVGTGYFLIPMEIDVTCVHAGSPAAAGNTLGIIAILDRTTAVPTSVTGTTETPVNMLDGATGFPGSAYSAIGVDITDPTMDELLCCRRRVAPGASIEYSGLDMHYEPSLPSIGKGPCGLYVYWGGVQKTHGVATIVVAAVPVAWMEN